MVYRFHATNLTGLSLLIVQLSLYKAETVLYATVHLVSLPVCDMSHMTTKLLNELSYKLPKDNNAMSPIYVL
jgi:hypothetical protein